MKELPVLEPDAGVILVASGYMFRCPECDCLGYCTSALVKSVACEHCQSEFQVIEVRHRTNDMDVKPGIPPDDLYIPQEDKNAPDDDQSDNAQILRKGRGEKKGGL